MLHIKLKLFGFGLLLGSILSQPYYLTNDTPGHWKLTFVVVTAILIMTAGLLTEPIKKDKSDV